MNIDFIVAVGITAVAAVKTAVLAIIAALGQ
jgi:hypothetical protein